MKFKMLGAALSLTAAFGLMACGDDNSTNAGSGDGSSCEVNVNGNVVTMTTTVAGTTSKQIWTLDTDKDEVTISYEPEVAGQQPMSMPAAGATVDLYKQTAEGLCKAMEEAEPANPGKDGSGEANGDGDGDGADAGIGGGDGDGGDAGIGGGDDEYEFPDKIDQCKVTRKGDAVTVEASAAGISVVDTKTLKNGVITEKVTYSGADAEKAFKSACADAKEDDPNATCNAATKTVTGSYEDEDGYESVDELEEDARNECDFLMNPDKYKEQIGDLLSGLEDLCGDDEECHAAFSEL